MILKSICSLLIMLPLCIGFVHGQKKRAPEKYRKVPEGYVMVLRQGDDLFAEIEKLARDEGIPGANFSGIGFVDVTFGYFNFETKEYNPKQFSNVELASLQGSIAWKENKASVHAHAVVGDENFQAFAGHVLNATVSTGSVELMVIVHDKRFERKKDESLGADVLDVTN